MAMMEALVADESRFVRFARQGTVLAADDKGRQVVSEPNLVTTRGRQLASFPTSPPRRGGKWRTG